METQYQCIGCFKDFVTVHRVWLSDLPPTTPLPLSFIFSIQSLKEEIDFPVDIQEIDVCL